MTQQTAPALLALAIDVAAVALVLRLFPALAAAVLRGTERRHHGLDGLRGAVALGVVASRSIILWTMLGSGRAGAPAGISTTSSARPRSRSSS